MRTTSSSPRAGGAGGPGRSRLLRGPWAIALAAGLMALVLFGSALLIQERIQRASEWAARGQGEALSLAIRDGLRSESESSQTVLDELLAEYAEDGLRYLALYDPRGERLASAGEARGTHLQPERLEPLDERVRYVVRLGPPGRRERRPGWNRPARERSGREFFAERRLRASLLVVELEPLASEALRREARGLLAVATVAGLGILALAWALARGLSQQERLRDELERGQRLAALGTMSAVLAHELRNPLAALKGHAQLLAEEVEGQPALEPRASRMVDGAVRLERLLNDLLRFVQDGALQRAPVDPNLPLQEAAAAVGGPIRVTAGPAAPVALDAGRLQQALENVLRNALEVTPAGARVEASLGREKGALIYRVRDAGPGLPPGAEDRLFEPFATFKTQGVGLGLAITRRIVELHGGTVGARTLPGGGAEFSFTLPLEEP